jgi:hypothetical protein
VADGSYWLGDICDNRFNRIHSTLGGGSMHTLGVSVWRVVTICHYERTGVWWLHHQVELRRVKPLLWRSLRLWGIDKEDF